MFWKLLNQVLALCYALFFKVNWIKFFKFYNKSSANVIWICPIFPSRSFEYLLRTTFIGDLAIIQTLIDNKQNFKIVLGKKIGKINNSNIFYTVSYHFNTFHLTNYAAGLQFVVKELEKQGNAIFPESQEVEYWENKAFMHQKFDELGINAPETLIVEPSNIQSIDFSILNYPLLWKDVHSAGALGVHKLNSYQDFKALFEKKKDIGINTFLIQNLINMRKDFRTTIVGDQIIHHYWRVNPSKDWKPTSTSHGSSVDFDFFPEQWRSHIIDSFKKLNITTGAFDITWENDDLSTMPIILEVSPSYDVNPPQPNDLKSISYKAYKKKITHKEAYFKGRVNYIFSIKHQLYDIYKSNANFKA